ncbi:MAG: ribosome maturation factor RimP [candidate division WOR-3 bacterium]|nr:ribosome maturation factor RimP [candidate division WOR-3 bacterium]MCX7947022.1 ribosome maturation factor RimP [candidate division WOR-3 bacterium]MDW8149937.1 ribosome maturation factor RimP [candidate division WOR-3 bacterium]
MQVELEVEKAIKPIIDAYGYVLVDIEYKGGKYGILKIFVDRLDGGITIKEIEKLSREISLILDAENIIEERYVLEVSSPGLDRELNKDRELRWAVSKKVKLFLKNGATFGGRLEQFNENEVVVSGKVYKRSEISKIKLDEV